MCVIAYKPSGVSIPESTIRNMFANNPDGAGVMWADDNEFHMRKGLMTIESLLSVLSGVPADAAAVIHCRIASHGKVIPELTHPFLVSRDADDLAELSADFPIGLETYAFAHNGIINGMDIKGHGRESDTYCYDRDILFPLSKAADATGHGLLSEIWRPTIEKTIDASRLAIFSLETGSVKLYGRGWSQYKGVWYSNTSYKPYVPTYYRPKYGTTYTGELNGHYTLYDWR